MNRAEIVVLARMVRALRPAQHWDEATPDAWALVLADVRREDAEVVIRQLGATSAWIDPPTIVAAVGKLRADRLDRTPVPVYPGDPDDWRAEREWKRQALAAIADGVQPPAPALALEAGPAVAPDVGRVRALVAQALGGRPVPKADDRWRPRPAHLGGPVRQAADPEAAARAEAERERQLRLLEAAGVAPGRPEGPRGPHNPVSGPHPATHGTSQHTQKTGAA